MKEIVIRKLQDFLTDYQTNEHISTRWGAPIVGFASADDTLFVQFRGVGSRQLRFE